MSNSPIMNSRKCWALKAHREAAITWPPTGDVTLPRQTIPDSGCTLRCFDAPASIKDCRSTIGYILVLLIRHTAITICKSYANEVPPSIQRRASDPSIHRWWKFNHLFLIWLFHCQFLLAFYFFFFEIIFNIMHFYQPDIIYFLMIFFKIISKLLFML